MAYIQFLGAAGVVTGSKHLINTSSDSSGKSGFQLLIDCGLFQGPKQWRERNWQDMPVPAKEIDAVVLTHAHLDHSGWIPRLVKEGFRGQIYATRPTIDLCGILLPDSGHLQEEDAEFSTNTKVRSTPRRCLSTPCRKRRPPSNTSSQLRWASPSSFVPSYPSGASAQHTFWVLAWWKSLSRQTV